jgi:hypothetical protein
MVLERAMANAAPAKVCLLSAQNLRHGIDEAIDIESGQRYVA